MVLMSMLDNIKFPIFVRIADEETFVRAESMQDLQWFEQQDIDSEPHYAWDLNGQQYQLYWKGHVTPHLIERNGLPALALAISEYERKLIDKGFQSIHKRCVHPFEIKRTFPNLGSK